MPDVKHVVVTVAMVLGLVFFIGGPLLSTKMVPRKLHDGVRDEIVVTSKDSKGFSDWQCTSCNVPRLRYDTSVSTSHTNVNTPKSVVSSDTFPRDVAFVPVLGSLVCTCAHPHRSRMVPQIREFTLFNLTNPDDVVNTGAKPNYHEVGPFVYRLIQSYDDPVWNAEASRVNVQMSTRFFFEPTKSVGDPDSVIIHNVNHVFVTALKTAKGEDQLEVALAATTKAAGVEMAFSWLIDPRFSAWLTSIPTTGDLAARMMSLELLMSRDEALGHWANTTSLKDILVENADFTNFLVSEDTGAASEVPLEAARALFDGQRQFAITNLDYDTVHTWWRALHNNDAVSQSQLQASFSLTDTQFTMVSDWMRRFQQNVVMPEICNDMGLASDCSKLELAVLQWGTGKCTQGQSIRDAIPDFKLGYVPEYFAFAAQDHKKITVITEDDADELVSGPNSFTIPTNVLEYLKLEAEGKHDDIAKLWPFLDSTDVRSVWSGTRGYLEHVERRFATHISYADIEAQGGGVVTMRPASHYLFSGTDPLVKWLQPANAATSLFKNDTVTPIRFATGAHDIDDIGEILDVDNMPDVEVWANDYAIEGHQSQFRPFQGEEGLDSVDVWELESMRTVKMNNTGQAPSVFGIHVNRFVAAPPTWAENGLFFQSLPGFLNLSTAHHDAPIYISEWDLHGQCDDKWADMVTGLNKSAAPDSYLDIEPVLGKVFREGKSVQINVYVEPELQKMLNKHKSFPIGFMAPLVKYYEHTEITEDVATKYRDGVGMGKAIGQYFMWGGVGGGILCIVVAAAVGASVLRERRVGRLRSRGLEYSRLTGPGGSFNHGLAGSPPRGSNRLPPAHVRVDPPTTPCADTHILSLTPGQGRPGGSNSVNSPTPPSSDGDA